MLLQFRIIVSMHNFTWAAKLSVLFLGSDIHGNIDSIAHPQEKKAALCKTKLDGENPSDVRAHSTLIYIFFVPNRIEPKRFKFFM